MLCRNRSFPVLSLGGALLTLALMLAGLAQAQSTKSLPGSPFGDVSKEELDLLVSLCETCHGENGVSTREDVPTLAGRPNVSTSTNGSARTCPWTRRTRPGAT